MIDYLLHRNGRGKLFDDAEANANTYIDRTSSASGSAKLRDCELRGGSRAEGNCQVYGGIFTHSKVVGRTVVAGNPTVGYSLLNCSEVSGTPLIIFSELLGQTEVCDSPEILRSHLEDAIIYGNPQIYDCHITGRVHEGVWHHPPKHIKLPWCDLSECVEGKLLLDCYCRPISFWLRHGRRIAAKWDWSEDMIAVTLETIEREFQQQRMAA